MKVRSGKSPGRTNDRGFLSPPPFGSFGEIDRPYKQPWPRCVAAVRFVRGNRQAVQTTVASFPRPRSVRSGERGRIGFVSSRRFLFTWLRCVGTALRGRIARAGRVEPCRIVKDREGTAARSLEPYYRRGAVLRIDRSRGA